MRFDCFFTIYKYIHVCVCVKVSDTEWEVGKDKGVNKEIKRDSY